ncbi:hypothetical protein [Pedobacter steynii]|uniref:Uncharacterized protein n=1 Tax=Pedobacter steynii TaxID=430522 RepID=A0A1D7QCX3_9SPHI|nr:hypothetical protein [Pedobacter steynii]AOM76409.1 hypothetical protein BFS30_04115 [Pedobacter steynii]
MNLKLLFSLLSLMIALALGCKKEPVIQPDTLQPEYQLPQGNQPYDNKILDFYKKYGTYILYKFNDKDFQWNISANILYAADPGDQDYIAQSLEMMDKKLFSFYTEPFLKLSLPYKILLSSRIRRVVAPDTLATPVNAVSTFSHFTFGQASPRLGNLTEQELTVMKNELHIAYWKQAVITKKVELPDLFIAATDYGMVQDYNKNEYGVFTYSYGMTASDDFLDYITAIVSHTAEELEATIFLPENDPQGRFKFKYNAVINYYKAKYNLDLQAIGNSK